jgi:hypothetical protein
MQIALVAVVLLAGMWFTVLKPKPAAETATVTPVAVTPAPASSEPAAPGVKGLTSAVEKAKGASAASDAANAKIQKATGSAPAASAPAKAKPAASKPAATKTSKGAKPTTPAKAKAKTTAAVKTSTKGAAPAATLKAEPAAAATPATPAKKAVDTDPSGRLLKFLDKGKTLVILFHGAGADDRGARKAVHRTAKADPKHVTSAYVPIGDVGKYEAITSDVQILASPSILVIGTNGKATLLTGYVDAAVVRQAVGDARRASAADAKRKTTK